MPVIGNPIEPVDIYFLFYEYVVEALPLYQAHLKKSLEITSNTSINDFF